MNGKAAAAVSSQAQLQQRISRVLSGWNALQMAVHNKWGGPDSIHKSHHLYSDIFSSLFQTKGNISNLIFLYYNFHHHEKQYLSYKMTADCSCIFLSSLNFSLCPTIKMKAFDMKCFYLIIYVCV